MVRRASLCLIAGFVVTPAAAQQQPKTSTTSTDIVVTGASLKDLQAALARCREQHCPPDKDIAATLAVAETQFVAGDYKAARTTMLDSLGRNRRFAKSYPVPVSDLLRANSRVAAHLGEEGAYFNGALDVVSALKAGLPDNDWRVLGARVELGDAFAKTGRLDSAIEFYDKVVRQAHALQLGRVEGYAMLRVAAVNAAASQTRDDPYYRAALKAYDALIASTDPSMKPFVAPAALLKAKLEVKRGDAGAVDRLVATYRAMAAGATAPVLLYAPQIKQPELSGREVSNGETLGKVAMNDFDGQWVDISFTIGADGTVGDAEMLRKSAKLSGDWVKPVLTAIAGRRYAPLASESPGFVRVERYSYTAAWTTSTESRMRVRSPIPRIEMVDLSRDPPTPGS